MCVTKYYFFGHVIILEFLSYGCLHELNCSILFKYFPIF